MSTVLPWALPVGTQSMTRRKTGSMAHPRSSSRGASSSHGKQQDDSERVVAAFLLRIATSFVVWLKGPTGQQLLSLGVTVFGLLTLYAIYDPNSGVLLNGWARFLVFSFGWGAYPMGALVAGLGLLWLRHLVHRPMTWRWRPVLGFEMTLIALLTLTHTLLNQRGWGLVESGMGGGVVGWGLYVFFSDYFGPLVTGFLMGVVMLIGLGLAFDLTRADLKLFGQRVVEVGAAMRDRRAGASAPEPAAQVSSSIAVSPVPQRGRAAPPPLDVPVPEPAVAAPPKRKAPPKTRRKPAAGAPPPPRDVALPPLTLLKQARRAGMDQHEIQRKSRIIENTLKQFNIPVSVIETRVGPTVTQFGVSPEYTIEVEEAGKTRTEATRVRVSQITTLADDLALALAAKSLRMQAPVPGRSIVGIEVPNADVALVTLRGVLESEAFAKCGKPLCFAVGVDVAGSAIVADLAKMPHLLVAGTTGSGKSVFIKALAASLVMSNAPEDLRLIAIDPKMVELSHLNGLPHLLGKAETDLENIIRVLRWVAHEMDRRYKLFSATVSRHLDDYNRKMAHKDGGEKLPRIVVFIDELADLMMSAPEETEKTLTRIAQMARATGIHLVVATQRPSTDVVTGLIKANFPARVSFATTSNVDSRVIIDTPGAESLLGQGDMLFLPPDAAAPRRVQGCFISEREISAIIRFWTKNDGAMPDKAPWEVMADSKGPDMMRIEGQAEDAGLLERAIDLARKSGSISTSGLQRRLRISYPRAARLMEEMERMGLVGPQESAGRKRRVILGGDED